MKKFVLILTGIILLMVCVVSILGYLHMRDRHPGYTMDLSIPAAEEGRPLLVGFGKQPITPDITDTWEDANGDSRYDPEDGDTYTDRNGNGRFDAFWMAGFHNARPAQGIHDDLWARALVIDDGRTRIGLVVLDVIGFGHDHVIDTRRRIMSEIEMDYVLICSTHNHEAPDLIGLWGPGYLKSGVNPDYLEYVKNQTAGAVIQAAERLRPATLRFARDLTGAKPLVTDSRQPYVLDAGLRVMQAIDTATDTSLGVLVNWGNHPETLWSGNLQITSDFPHYVRRGIEQGLWEAGELRIPGIGGTAIYVNGAIGGLMTTDPDFPVADPFRDTVYTEPTFAKARAQGEQIAWLALTALRASQVQTMDSGALGLRARTIHFPVDNFTFRLGAFLGVLDRGFTGWMNLRSEIAGWTLGPASFVGIPGEIYPEIINGGIEAPDGRDFPVGPAEVPPIREMMSGEYRFVLGLANDEIGYIIPRSEWDEEPPYLYDAQDSPYGEGMALGPDTAPILHSAIQELWNDLE